jgi:hypothetical protein
MVRTVEHDDPILRLFLNRLFVFLEKVFDTLFQKLVNGAVKIDGEFLDRFEEFFI